MRSSPLALVATLLLSPALAFAYPLDGYETTGIDRLAVQRAVQEGRVAGQKRPAGELLPLERVDLRLLRQRNLDLPEIDPQFTAELIALIGPDRDRYGFSLLDVSDPEKPRYAEYEGRRHQNPGSVGKLLVALALFQGLADAFPDLDTRKRILRETIIEVDEFARGDHHTVWIANAAEGKLERRPLHAGDRASLYTFLDWMVSPSSNAAAAMLQKQLILIRHFGSRYPVSSEESAKFFAETPKTELGSIFVAAITEPVSRNGLDLDQLRQGSFFTSRGKQLVPGTSSYATARELTTFALRMEQGRLVDLFSSREIKRLMYVTERRIRYGSSGVLRDSALYFKSGSLYSCKPEEGFDCGKYRGNVRNYMNSVAILESPAGQQRLHYIVSVLSNVLKKNSAVDHRDLARAVHAKLLAEHPGRSSAIDFGEGFIGYEAERRTVVLAAETQEALSDLGYPVGEIDGQIGRESRAAIRQFQRENGLRETGEPSEALLESMRKVARERGLTRPSGSPEAQAPPTSGD